MTAPRKEIIGDAELWLGDCLEVMADMADGSVDAVVTDPPYGVALQGKTQLSGGKIQKTRMVEIQYTDRPEDIADLIRKAIPECLRISQRAGIFTGNRMIREYPQSASIGGIFEPAACGRDPWGFSNFSPILYYGKDPWLSAGLGSRPNSMKGSGTAAENVEHPTPKPLYWMLWLVNRVSPSDGESVLDPFMGSGTTGVACANLGRKFIGIEIEPKYYDIARRRIELAYNQQRLPLGE